MISNASWLYNEVKMSIDISQGSTLPPLQLFQILRRKHSRFHWGLYKVSVATDWISWCWSGTLERKLTAGHPLQWDLTSSSTIPTAASFASIDLTTPFASFPAASRGPASVLTRVRVCLRGNRKCDVRIRKGGGGARGSARKRRSLPGHHLSGSRSAGVHG